MNTHPSPQPRAFSDTLFLAAFGIAFAVGTVFLISGMTDLAQALISLDDTLRNIVAVKKL